MGEPHARAPASFLSDVLLTPQAVEDVDLMRSKLTLDRLTRVAYVEAVKRQELRHEMVDGSARVRSAQPSAKVGREVGQGSSDSPFEKELDEQHVMTADVRRFLSGTLPIPLAETLKLFLFLDGESVSLEQDVPRHFSLQSFGLFTRPAAEEQGNFVGPVSLACVLNDRESFAPESSSLHLLGWGERIVEADYDGTTLPL